MRMGIFKKYYISILTVIMLLITTLSVVPALMGETSQEGEDGDNFTVELTAADGRWQAGGMTGGGFDWQYKKFNATVSGGKSTYTYYFDLGITEYGHEEVPPISTSNTTISWSNNPSLIRPYSAGSTTTARVNVEDANGNWAYDSVTFTIPNRRGIRFYPKVLANEGSFWDIIRHTPTVEYPYGEIEIKYPIGKTPVGYKYPDAFIDIVNSNSYWDHAITVRNNNGEFLVPDQYNIPVDPFYADPGDTGWLNRVSDASMPPWPNSDVGEWWVLQSFEPEYDRIGAFSVLMNADDGRIDGAVDGDRPDHHSTHPYVNVEIGLYKAETKVFDPHGSHYAVLEDKGELVWGPVTFTYDDLVKRSWGCMNPIVGVPRHPVWFGPGFESINYVTHHPESCDVDEWWWENETINPGGAPPEWWNKIHSSWNEYYVDLGDDGFINSDGYGQITSPYAMPNSGIEVEPGEKYYIGINFGRNLDYWDEWFAGGCSGANDFMDWAVKTSNGYEKGTAKIYEIEGFADNAFNKPVDLGTDLCFSVWGWNEPPNKPEFKHPENGQTVELEKYGSDGHASEFVTPNDGKLGTYLRVEDITDPDDKHENLRVYFYGAIDPSNQYRTVNDLIKEENLIGMVGTGVSNSNEAKMFWPDLQYSGDIPYKWTAVVRDQRLQRTNTAPPSDDESMVDAAGGVNEFYTSPYTGEPPQVNIEPPVIEILQCMTFEPIPLDNFVYDPDTDDSDLEWGYEIINSDGLDVEINIDQDRVVHVTYTGVGSAVIEFTATDPEGHSGSDTVTFIVVSDHEDPKDTDSDGIPDSEDPDDDNDGWTDEEEIREGTDPKDPADYPEGDPEDEPFLNRFFRNLERFRTGEISLKEFFFSLFQFFYF